MPCCAYWAMTPELKYRSVHPNGGKGGPGTGGRPALPDRVNAWDTDRPAAVGTRRMLLANDQPIYAPHLPYPGRGRFQRQGEVVAWAA